MKRFSLALLALLTFFTACQNSSDRAANGLNLNGSWKLIKGSIITNGVVQITDYTKDQEMIKVINNDHFCFLKHPKTNTPDSANKFDAGGGRYELKGDKYIEHLDFYNDKKFEGTSYTFTLSLKGDTLIQQGNETADRKIIEKYVRIK